MFSLIATMLTSAGTSLAVSSSKALFTPGSGGISDYLNAAFYTHISKNMIENAKDIQAQRQYERDHNCYPNTITEESANQLEELSKEIDDFKKIFNEKLNQIPEENRINPRREIVVPIMTDIQTYGSDEELRKMFANLLASAMDKTNYSNTRPSFVQMIKEMSPVDAKILSIIEDEIPSVDIKWTFQNGTFMLQHSNVIFHNALDYSSSAISASLDNLVRLNLINFIDGLNITEFDYSTFSSTPEYQDADVKLSAAKAEANLKKAHTSLNLKEELVLNASITTTNSECRSTELGKIFKRICIES